MNANISAVVSSSLYELWRSRPDLTADEITSTLACEILKQQKISLFTIDQAQNYYSYYYKKIEAPSELSHSNQTSGIETLLKRMVIRLTNETLLKMYQLKRDQPQLEKIKKLLSRGDCVLAIQKALALYSNFTQTIALNQIKEYVQTIPPSENVEKMQAILDRDDIQGCTPQLENLKKEIYLPDACSQKEGPFRFHVAAAIAQMLKHWNTPA